MRVLMVILAMLLIGCGSFATPGEVGPQGPPGAPGMDGAPGPKGINGEGFSSGSRLKIRAIVYEDGAQMPTHLVDSKYGVACALRTAGDGYSRCLPVDTAQIRYLDATCDGPAVTHSACAAPKFAAESTPASYACGTAYNGDDSTIIIRRVLGAIDPPSAIYTRNQVTDTCVGVSELPAGAWYELGPEMAPEDFVAGDTVTNL